MSWPASCKASWAWARSSKPFRPTARAHGAGLVRCARTGGHPSWFRAPADLASPRASIEQLGGRGVVTSVRPPSPPLKSEEENLRFLRHAGPQLPPGPARAVSHRVPGRTLSPGLGCSVEQSQDFWREPGRAAVRRLVFSDSDRDIWRYFWTGRRPGWPARPRPERIRPGRVEGLPVSMPQGQLTAFYGRGLDLGPGQGAASVVPMNEARTGFVRAVH